MKARYNISTKDKVEVSYCAFILNTLISIGLSPSCKGTYYIRDIILIALKKYNADINLKILQRQLAISKHISQNTIKTNIDYAFKYHDAKKAQSNFKKIFNIEYDTYFITAKTIVSLLVSQIYNMKNEEK